MVPLGLVQPHSLGLPEAPIRLRSTARGRHIAFLRLTPSPAGGLDAPHLHARQTTDCAQAHPATLCILSPARTCGLVQRMKATSPTQCGTRVPRLKFAYSTFREGKSWTRLAHRGEQPSCVLLFCCASMSETGQKRSVNDRFRKRTVMRRSQRRRMRAKAPAQRLARAFLSLARCEGAASRPSGFDRC
jgi:hypothetical protein